MANNRSNIGEVLFTKTQQRVLGILYGRPDSSYYLNEIVRLADMGKGTVRRELDKLVLAGLIRVFKQGNQSHFQANENNPIFNELNQIVKKTFGVVGVLTAALEDILTGVKYAFVYGSVAKGEEHAGSDVDLMLVGESLSYTDVMASLDTAEQQLSRRINPTLLSMEELVNRINSNQSFVVRLLSQNVLWLKGELEFTAHFGEKIKHLSEASA